MLRWSATAARHGIRPCTLRHVFRSHYSTPVNQAKGRYATSKWSQRLPTTPASPSTIQVRPKPQARLPARILKEERVKELYGRGIRTIYTAPSHRGKLAAAWILGGSLIASAIDLFTTGRWSMKDQPGMTEFNKSFVESSYRVSMIVLSALGGYAIARYTGLVKSIRLVNAGGHVRMRITARKFLPGTSKEFTVAPWDLVLPRRWSENLPKLSTRWGTAGFIITLFRKIQAWFLMDGIFFVRFNDGDAKGLLDMTGKFEVSPEEFAAITSEADR